MIKTVLCTMLSLLCAASLRAQAEPGQSPAAAASRPPTIHDAAHAPAEQSPPPLAAASTEGQPQIEKNPPALDPRNMDTSVKPEDDFFRYANGTWLKSNPVPPEYSRWGSFNELIEKNNDALHEIAEQAAKVETTGSGRPKIEKAAAAEVQKVGDFYASGMNEDAITAASGNRGRRSFLEGRPPCRPRLLSYSQQQPTDHFGSLRHRHHMRLNLSANISRPETLRDRLGCDHCRIAEERGIALLDLVS